jgi:ectoine hydroxylase-related dioxygenase (phytanoyl-CoA dioxygenase family)
MATLTEHSPIAAFETDANPDAISNCLTEDGVVIVRGVLTPDILDAFNAEIDTHFAADGQAERAYMNDTVKAFFGKQTSHLSGLAGKSQTFRDQVLCHDLLMAVCDHVLRPNCAVYQLNFADVMDRGPGAPAQIFHRDDGIWPHLPRQDFPLEFATMIAMGPFTPQMGSTRIVPGSHRWPKDREAQESEVVAVELEPGDAAFYLGSTLHAGGANNTGHRRRGMHLSYCLGWLRTEDNNYLSTPLSLARTLSRQQQTILGYGIHDGIEVGGGFVGAVDWRNPVDLIAEGLL